MKASEGATAFNQLVCERIMEIRMIHQVHPVLERSAIDGVCICLLGASCFPTSAITLLFSSR